MQSININGQKNPELLPKSWKVNGNFFFQLFLFDLDEKMTSAGYKRERNKKQSRTAQLRHSEQKK